MSAVLEVEGVSKTFTRTKALAGVSMTIEPGEVHALLGQNGSGKSTLIKILSGYHAPDPGGGIRVEGNDLPLQSPVQSYRLGCRFVQQDLGLVSTLSVLDNMALGSGFPTSFGTINGKATYRQAKNDLERLSLDINPKALVATLSASERTGVAIARALREDPEYPACLLVLDEPTATLPVDEVDNLLDRVSAMAATGVGVLYVTHHLGEVFRVAHKVSVFRDGRVVGAGPVKEFDHGAIVELLAGEELLAEETESRREKAGRAAAREHETVFEVKRSTRGSPRGRVLQRRARRDRRNRGPRRFRPGQRSRRELRCAPPRRGRGDADGSGASGRPARCRHRPRSRIPGARPEGRRRRDDDERARESHAAGPEAVLEGRAPPPTDRDGKDHGMVRAALGQTGDRRQRAAQHLQRRESAEDPVRQVAVAGAVGIPAGRADPGRRRRRQGRSPPRARHGSPERSRGCRQLE